VRILVVGSGGREHALCWKIKQSPKCEKLYAAPGNGGISETAQIVNIDSDDIDGLISFAKTNSIDLTVVGPETPLVNGIVDRFAEAGLKAFGPSKELAQLEGSKIFAKETMRRFGIPTAGFRVFDNSPDAIAYINEKGAPLVVKADGLSAGKGVIVCKIKCEAEEAVKKILDDKIFGEAGKRILIEDCLVGEEASLIAVCDGRDFVMLASSQDHKRVYDGDKGPNTGGMGAYSPAPVVTDELLGRIKSSVIMPLVNGLAGENKFYKGAIYAGIMVTADGPMVLEFNVRFGDPETQAILPRLGTDLVEIMERSIEGKLSGFVLGWDPRPCVSVVLASGGYPGNYEKGLEIHGVREASAMKDVVVFHAGTKYGRRTGDEEGLYITNGGRVLNVTALGDNVKEAIDKCYAAAQKIGFDGMHYRRDIGYRAVKR